MNNSTKAKATHKNVAPSNDLMTIGQLMEFLPSKPSVKVVYNWIYRKKIPHYKTPGTQLIHFRKSEIENWLLGKEVTNG
jgi:predicted DNA-binding transcriptional regulator AlpA